MKHAKTTKRASLAIAAAAALTATIATVPATAGASVIGGVSISETGDGLVITGSSDKDAVSITSAPDGALAIQVFADSGELLGDRLVSEFAGDLTVNLGNNDDAVVVKGVDVGAVKINMGAGKDSADLEKVSLSSLELYGGQGDDSLGINEVRGARAQMATGGGKASISISGSVFKQTTISTANDDDQVSISQSSLGELGIFTHNGDDEVTTDWILFGGLTLALGEGDDFASIGADDDLDASYIGIYGQDGDDTLIVGSGFAINPQTAIFNGGADHDTFKPAAGKSAVDDWFLLLVEEIAP
ncbi:MAG: hypothetical protein GY724_03100 [Actinomycetia bacterium]|nr:hypothetical protein [Actinomycetes bacterium]MCP5030862.1 hypothetical protein [Actinomycetes bacterium]